MRGYCTPNYSSGTNPQPPANVDTIRESGVWGRSFTDHTSLSIISFSNMPGSGSSEGDPRRYGFACSTCRRKKVRCDGTRPVCRKCSKSGVECFYKPESGDLWLLQQLRNSNKRVRELEEQMRNLLSTKETEAANILPQSSEHGSTRKSPTCPALELIDAIGDEEKVRESALDELSVDENGKVQYFGATSRFYVPTEHTTQARGQAELDRSSDFVDATKHRTWLQSSSKLQKSWERLAFANLQNERSDINPQLAADLLQIYWAWQHPLHNCVYRPCFSRDMALGGPYFSEFLLYTLYAHASRHANTDDPRFKDIGRGERFLAKAKLLLQSEMEQPRPKIPTIQALLILGGRQCAVGKSSEGWLYTGMAIRMMKDIGLHLNMKRLAHLEKLAPEDLEVRKRLFLSAYAWDKSISTCLGRPPSLIEMPYAPESLSNSDHCLMSSIDHSDDDEMWTPCFLDDEVLYPPTKSFNTQVFISFCRLSQLINESYDIIYKVKTRKGILSKSIIELDGRIRAFYSCLPEGLRIENISSMPFCPPPHIFSLNILYHVTLILLYRPFLFSSTSSLTKDDDFNIRAHRICVERTKINQFLKAHHRTFNFKIQTYLVSYCVYTAATIDAFEIKSHDDTAATEAAQRLSTTLKMLETEARQTPGIKRSIEIIKTQLQTHTEVAHDRHATVEDYNDVQRQNFSIETQQVTLFTPVYQVCLHLLVSHHHMFLFWDGHR
ncbi:uncharacterized protein LY89DRAFT_638427 [Mollisia scopiformis]|uniref:Zn(2)-C6 fungal-type domain-containing protein n=1 Tax=Mollisia scopiformis TaxID=149040 RepID=A0A194XQ87_MOLSC|nr:uncharacterized protein LY89DRAFT_638427 [Mollisia scopiformis]KUJ22219.1 hypothetical protein LY89DRAFT_638427 [Mollisia scopiformis]